jgi:hypothetical protein
MWRQVEADPVAAEAVTVHYEDNPLPVDHPTVHRADGRYGAGVFADQPRTYRVTVGRGGTSTISGAPELTLWSGARSPAS